MKLSSFLMKVGESGRGRASEKGSVLYMDTSKQVNKKTGQSRRTANSRQTLN